MTAADGNWAGSSKNRLGGERWRGRIPIPPKAHPLVRKLIKAANDERTTLGELAVKSGVPRATITSWRYRSAPRVDLLVACFNALDLDLAVQPLEDDAR